MEELERLRALTEADRWIERVIAQREHLPEMQELSVLEAELRSLLGALNAVQSGAEPLRARYLSAQGVSAKLAARVGELEGALAKSTGSARDLAAMQKELEQLRERLASAEDEELTVMLEIEPLDEEIASIKERSQPGVERRGELQATIGELRAGLDEEIAALRETRAELADALAAPWRQRYDAALKRSGVSGAAFVDAGRCDGCRIALSPLDFDRFSQLGEDVVMDCPECGRMLLR